MYTSEIYCLSFYILEVLELYVGVLVIDHDMGSQKGVLLEGCEATEERRMYVV